MKSLVRFKLHVLSPIHIGCDDVYEPTSFVIDDKKGELIEFDPIDFVRALNEKQREEFIRVCSRESLLSVIKFVKANYNPKIGGRKVEVAQGVIEHYKKVLNLSSFDKKTIINQFTINKTSYNVQTNKPYIPGSSIKGSIRTAYLNILAKRAEIRNFWESSNLLSRQDLENSEITYRQIGKKQISKKLEQKLLKGEFSNDPFRMLKVSDFLPVGEVKTKIVYAVNRKKERISGETLAEKGGVYQIFEVIKPGSVFEGFISIEQPLEGSGILEPLNFENLFSSLHSFYAGNLNREVKPLNEVLKIKHQAGIDANTKFKDKFKKDAFLIRIGRHSGAEAVTIEGNRHIKIMQGRDRPPLYLDRATTFWLASDSPKPKTNNGLLPFGWAVIELVK
ncbi:MAG: type III-A CRISPR-associated RAMP protein Csm5 [Thermodesulfovibrio sp.]|nr:type III-A CRISPR-associated RAMP protein Csm5 [Thermodesulfovibrio sp.]